MKRGVWYLAIGAGALRSCVIPNKRTNGALSRLSLAYGWHVYGVWLTNGSPHAITAVFIFRPNR